MSKIEEKIVAEITADFKKRQEARRPIELNWRLNMNFVVGNQFAQISSKGDIEESGKEYFWQEREVITQVPKVLRAALVQRLSHRLPLPRPVPAALAETAAAVQALAVRLWCKTLTSKARHPPCLISLFFPIPWWPATALTAARALTVSC